MQKQTFLEPLIKYTVLLLGVLTLINGTSQAQADIVKVKIDNVVCGELDPMIIGDGCFLSGISQGESLGLLIPIEIMSQELYESLTIGAVVGFDRATVSVPPSDVQSVLQSLSDDTKAHYLSASEAIVLDLLAE